MLYVSLVEDFCRFCICCNIISIPLGNNSLLSTFHSTDILPGPVSKRLIDIAINNKSSSCMVFVTLHKKMSNDY